MLEEKNNSSDARLALIFVIGCLTGALCALSFCFQEQSAKTLYSEPPQNLLCQPFKNPKQMEMESQQLTANGYRILLYQDLPNAYTQRSQGKGQIIEQSNLQCFDRGFVTQHWLANELWFKEVAQ